MYYRFVLPLSAISYFRNEFLISRESERVLKRFSELLSENNAPSLCIKFVERIQEEILFPAASCLTSLSDTQPISFQSLIQKM